MVSTGHRCLFGYQITDQRVFVLNRIYGARIKVKLLSQDNLVPYPKKYVRKNSAKILHKLNYLFRFSKIKFVLSIKKINIFNIKYLKLN
ncbi:hypothetical protein BpHYR1_033250 [Brachionus plicatilis]|uniref:Uncharacterized protein n=1 Tax=Brachionus plicatilis TaxID=10195 RepID=A0A3M7PHQ4_BRAPC|nr:hypothetical protein BpHYR1_033250 [Brachionus plicatilis]